MRIILFLVIYSIAAHANPEASEEKPSDSSSDVVNFLDSSELEARLINFFVFGFVLMRDVRFDPYRNPIRVLMGALTAGMLYSAYHGKAHYLWFAWPMNIAMLTVSLLMAKHFYQDYGILP